MTERTFILIKPDHVEFADSILEELKHLGNQKVIVHLSEVPREVIEEHYAPHRDKPFYPYLVESFIGKPVVAGVYYGPDVVRQVMELCGPTDPAKAPENTIRWKYSADSLDRAIAEGRPVRNVIHRSDSAAEAEREIKVWKEYLKP